jgi:hypothetical protein
MALSGTQAKGYIACAEGRRLEILDPRVQAGNIIGADCIKNGRVYAPTPCTLAMEAIACLEGCHPLLSGEKLIDVRDEQLLTSCDITQGNKTHASCWIVCNTKIGCTTVIEVAGGRVKAQLTWGRRRTYLACALSVPAKGKGRARERVFQRHIGGECMLNPAHCRAFLQLQKLHLQAWTLFTIDRRRQLLR